ncbi:hypothetical protein AB4Y40_20990 [Paraburkholderia sp. EG287B]|uniref:hypothetical protein n=1 Tax=Paraburkholderia sp. EG287B TaxID=3237010 RepID=UPI0034D1E1AA
MPSIAALQRNGPPRVIEAGRFFAHAASILEGKTPRSEIRQIVLYCPGVTPGFTEKQGTSRTQIPLHPQWFDPPEAPRVVCVAPCVARAMKRNALDGRVFLRAVMAVDSV